LCSQLNDDKKQQKYPYPYVEIFLWGLTYRDKHKTPDVLVSLSRLCDGLFPFNQQTSLTNGTGGIERSRALRQAAAIGVCLAMGTSVSVQPLASHLILFRMTWFINYANECAF
jgi:hypothetical protein